MISVFVPIVARSLKQRSIFIREARLEHLPVRDFEELPSGTFAATITYHFLKNTLGDIDNLTKGTLDAISKSLIQDDAQIKELHLFIKEHSDREGVEIELKEIATNPKTLELDTSTWRKSPLIKVSQKTKSKDRKKRKIKALKLLAIQKTQEAMDAAAKLGFATLQRNWQNNIR